VNGFSIGEAWSQAVAFLSAHFKMILIYAAAGVLLPLVIQLLLIGGTLESMLDPQAMIASGDNPFAALGAFGAGFVVAAILGQIIQSASYYASWRHGLSGGTEEPASTVTYALGAAAMWLIATIVLVIAAVLLIGFIVLAMILGMIAAIGMIGAAGAGGELSAGMFIGTMISGIIAGIPIALAYVAIPAGIYRTLVPNNAGDVFA